MVAIARGVEPPYVEENYRFAEQCLWVIVPSGFGLLFGVVARVFLNSVGCLPRRSGPPIRFLPATTRDVLIVVASVGVGLGCLHRVISPPTIYAKG